MSFVCLPILRNKKGQLFLFLLLLTSVVTTANDRSVAFYPTSNLNDTIGPPPRESKFFKNDRKIKDFAFKDINGASYTLRELEGKVVVLNFWYIACGPCQREIPELNKLVEEYKDTSDIIFIAIALDEEEGILKFIDSKPFKYTLIPNGRRIAASLRVNRFPTHVVLNKEGYILFHTTGFFPGITIPWLKKSIASLL